jgi:hypothetical protein
MERRWLTLLVLGAVGAFGVLGTADATDATTGRTDFGTFSLRPPESFHEDPGLPAEQTAALVPIYGEGEPDRRLVAYFDDGTGADASSFALSTVDAPLTLDPSLKQLFGAAVAGHFKRQLNLPFELDRVEVVGHDSSRRIEVWGTVTLERSKRTIEVAFFPGQSLHTVAVASFTAERLAALSPLVESCLDSFQSREPPAPWVRSRTLLSLIVWGAAGIAFVVVRLMRRRQRANASSPDALPSSR